MQPPPPPPPAPQYGYYQAPRTNSTAIVSLVAGISAFVFCPVIGGIVAIITGHVAIGQIQRTVEQGRGLAIAGLVLGYVHMTLILLIVVVFVLGAVARTVNA